MNRYLSADHIALQERVRRFGRDAIEPVARELDETAEFPWENVKLMAEMGLFGVPVPKDLGGLGLDYLSYILVVENFAVLVEAAFFSLFRLRGALWWALLAN